MAVHQPVEDLLEAVFDPSRVGVSFRAPFKLPAQMREVRIEKGQLVIVQ